MDILSFAHTNETRMKIHFEERWFSELWSHHNEQYRSDRWSWFWPPCEFRRTKIGRNIMTAPHACRVRAPFVIMRAFCYLWRRYRIRWFSGSRWDTLLVWYLNYLLNFKTHQDLNTSNLLPFWVCIHLSWKVVYWNIILMPRALLRSKWCNVRPASVAWSSPKSKKIFQLPPSRFRAKSACVVVSDAM